MKSIWVLYETSDPYEPREAVYFFADEETAKAALSKRVGKQTWRLDNRDKQFGPDIFIDEVKINTLDDVTPLED